MTVQFDRDVRVKVDALDIKGLHASFRVVKTLKKEPNSCELTIYNLKPENRDQIAQAEKPIVEILAGYKGRVAASDDIVDVGGALDAVGLGSEAEEEEPGLIFLGNMRDSSSAFEPPDWVTTLESGDGERATRFSRINQSFAAGTSLATVMTDVAKSMDVGIGNAVAKAKEGELLEAGSEFLNSITLSGQSMREMDRIVKSSGLEWSIQDGVFQVLDAGKPLEDVSIVLSPTTGMIGSPTIGNDGIIRVKTLLNSDIVPGRELEITSKALTQSSKVEGLGAVAGVNLDLDAALGLDLSASRFRAERVEYVGSNFDRPYYCDIEAKEI